jgi:hypothetical protein
MLDKELKDVPVDSSATPVEEKPVSEDQEPSTIEPSKESEPAEKDLLYNHKREMERKLAEQRDELPRIVQQVLEPVLDKLTQSTQAPKQPSTVDEMSLAQLQDLRNQVSAMENPDPVAIRQIDDAIVDRRVDQKLENRLGSFEANQRMESQRESSKTEALRLYPDLRNPQSDFYRAVDTALRLRGEEYVRSNPQAVLDVAARVAVESGVKPVRSTPAPNVARSRSAPAPEDEAPAITDEIKALKKHYEKALPEGKTFDEKRLQKLAEEAARIKNGGMKVDI